jgi:excisionase family DNA binding protein
MQKRTYSVREACSAIPCGTTKFYRLLKEGHLRAVKDGRNTRVFHEDLEAYFASLPPYTPRGGK